MNKIFFAFSIFFYSIVSLVHMCCAETNLATGKSYTVAPPQNYAPTALPSNVTALTDGDYSIGYFWTQKTTVGWVNAKTVNILLDIERASPIESILLSTAAGAGEVYYPEQIDVFVGQDLKHFLYVGDLASTIDRRPRSYETRRLRMDKVNAQGRYVLLVIRANGAYVFCDEIEVIEGKSAKTSQGDLTLDEARELPLRKSFLIKTTDDLKLAASSNAEITSRIPAIERKTASLNGTLVKSAGDVESEILRLRRDLLSEGKPEQTMLVQAVNPWDRITPISLSSEATALKVSVVVPISGYGHAGVKITNLSTELRQFSVSLQKPASTNAAIDIYQVPFVRSAAIEYVADPLVPVNGPVSLRPGESRLIFITAFGKKSGIWTGDLRISDGRQTSTIALTVQTVKTALPQIFALNSIDWADFDSSLIRDRKELAKKDRTAHHANVIVVNPKYLPHLGEGADFDQLLGYLKGQDKSSKVMLFMNFRDDKRKDGDGRLNFMDEKWRGSFIKWYANALSAASQAGFNINQIYFYPFDEVREKEIDQFIAFATWVRKMVPAIRLYATLGAPNSEKVLPNLDIAQIINKDEVLTKFSDEKAEKWLYDAQGPAKSLSPYIYYRLMAWKAFVGGYKGIGFWAYSDSGWGDNPGTAWDDFDGRRPDYAVIYEGDNKSIISSRRWEAWRMGIEDYELLTMYAKAKGEGSAKTLAKSVLENPQDTKKADEVRRQILRDLNQDKGNK